MMSTTEPLAPGSAASLPPDSAEDVEKQTVLANQSGLRWPLFLFAVALSGVLYASSWGPVLQRWYNDPTYSHGFLVLAASSWLTYRTWATGQLEDTRPSPAALLLMLALGATWLLAKAASVEVVGQLTLPAMILCVGWAFFGWKGAKALSVPIGILYFVWPVWDYLRPLLQDVTTFAVGGFLHAVGIPAAIYGNYVELPAGVFEIAEGCSGLHFFMAATTLAAIQGYLYIENRRSRYLLMLAAIFVSIFANWIRVAVVIIAGHVTDMQHWLLHEHYYFGWVVFSMMLLPVIFLGSRFHASTQRRMRMRLFSFAAPKHRVTVAAGMALFFLPSLSWSLLQYSSQPDKPPTLPTRIAGLALSGQASNTWAPTFPGADLSLSGQYHGDGVNVDLWVFYFARQDIGRELIGYGNSLARKTDGRVSEGDRAGEVVLTGRSGGSRKIVYRYIVNDEIVVSDRQAKIQQVLGNLSGTVTAYAVVVSNECKNSRSSCAEERILDEVANDFSMALAGD